MNFSELLQQNNLERTGVSHGIQQKMKRYDRYVKAITEAKIKLEKTKSDVAKKRIEAEITTGEEAMAALNEEICTGINNFVKNKGTNEKKPTILKKARDSKAAGGKTETEGKQPPSFTVDSVAAKIAAGEKISDKEEIDFYDTNKDAIDAEVLKLQEAASAAGDKPIPHTEVEKKKNKNTTKVVVGVLAAIGLAALALVGITAYNKNKSE